MDVPYLLYGASSLTHANHSLNIANVGTDIFLLDFILVTVQLAHAGATITNTTAEDSDLKLDYKGTWTSNDSPLFGGGTSTYTNTASSVQLTVNGSAHYMFGDKVNDHGPYTVTVDGSPETRLTGVSGCGGTFGKLCKKTSPSLMYFTSNIGEGEHSVIVKEHSWCRRILLRPGSIRRHNTIGIPLQLHLPSPRLLPIRLRPLRYLLEPAQPQHPLRQLGPART